MHGRENVRPAAGEDPCDLPDDRRRVRHEHQRVLVKDHVELTVPERSEIAHVAAHVVERRPATARERSDGRELS